MGYRNLPEYEYKGFKYKPEDDYEEDNIKRFHDVINPDGTRSRVPCSPYCHLTETNFRRWVDLGCPKREQFSKNLDNKDIEELWEKNAVRFINENNS
jgi:hypothetical protein